MEQNEIADQKSLRHRSPSYPYCGLERAIERCAAIHKLAGRHSIHFSHVVQAWGLEVKSSGGSQTIAALKQFGLIVVDGVTDSRKIRLSDLGLQILLDTRVGRREEALRTAVSNPPLYKAIIDEYGIPTAAESVLQSHLTVDLGFNSAAVGPLVREFKASLAYAGLEKSGIIPDSLGDNFGAVEELPMMSTEPIGHVGRQTQPVSVTATRQQTPNTSVQQSAADQGEQQILQMRTKAGNSYRVLVCGDVTDEDLHKLIANIASNFDLTTK